MKQIKSIFKLYFTAYLVIFISLVYSYPIDPAQVTYTPTVQYLPHRLSGVVRCYIQANPPIQFVMWTRDKHLLEPYETDGFAVMSNGSLLIDRVKESHQGKQSKTLSLHAIEILGENCYYITLRDVYLYAV